MQKILVLNGPNLNLLGQREPEIYGSDTLEDINDRIRSYAEGQGIECLFFQSNHEGEIIDKIHEYRQNCDGIIINPGAFTHTSIAIRDALSAVNLPAIEVHLSNVFAREEFRKHSYISPVATGVISGLGSRGYLLAVNALINLNKTS